MVTAHEIGVYTAWTESQAIELNERVGINVFLSSW